MYLKRVLILLGWMVLFLSKNFAQVNADFYANVTSGCGSLAASFTDISTSSGGTITDWEWNLGGVTVTSEQAGRIFPVGSFEICLTVTDSNGDSDTECKTDYIQVFALPIANFEADKVGGCSPLDVVFTDLSSSPGGAIVEWIWGVGGEEGVIVDDGSLSAIENMYSIHDAYDVSLTITNENGCVGTITQSDFIIVSPDPDVQVAAASSFQCTPPFNVSFINQNIETGIEYIWTFGNGDNYVGVTPPSITYDNPGEYDVQVIGVNIVTGCSDTLFLKDYIAVGYPVEFTYDQTEVCAGEPVIFEDLSPIAADAVLWNFGDGNTSGEANPSYNFPNAGCFTVSLTREQNGCSTTVFADVCIKVNPLPAVSFTSDASIGCTVPHITNFVGTSADAVSWFWEFGESGSVGTSTQQNPTVTFPDFGEFPIYLTVTDAEGCSNMVSMDTIKLIKLNAALPAGEIQGCVPITFSLTDASVTAAPITDWYWEINTPSGLLTSMDSNPSFTIPDTGCYDVMLVVTNALGCVDTSIINDAVCGGMQPTVNFDATPVDACIDSDVAFTDMSSSYVDDWFWTFGDSTFAFSQNPEHEYVDTGSFDVTLTAFHHGCSYTFTKEDFIHTLAPKAKFTLERLCNNPYDIVLESTSVGADEISWDFGDASTDMDTSSMVLTNYTYQDTGAYVITLVAYNFTTGCVDSAMVDYYITDPKAEFSFDVTEGCVPLTITPINNSVFAEEYEWYSSNASFSEINIAQPEITFSQSGTYNEDIHLIVTDINGCKDTLDYSGEIKVNGVTVDFTMTPPEGCQPTTVDFEDNSSSLFGNLVSWNWNIGDGLQTSTDQNPSYTFDTIGVFPTSLTVTDDWGCENVLDIPDAVSVTKPFAKFKGDTLGCTLLEMKYLNQSHGTGLTYEWDFGDGTISTDKHPKHEYLTQGIFTICLTVTDVNGCTDVYCLDDYVEIADPIAGFASDVTSAACPPLIVSFESTSQNTTTYQWDFGDGSGSSNIENPLHVYTIPGVFDVTVIASSNVACQDTFTIQNYISLDGPEGSFTFEMDNPCTPTEVIFYAESNDFYTYIWDFGDGALDTSGFKMVDTVSHYYSEGSDVIPTLILVDNQGCNRPIMSLDTIKLVTLGVDFVASATTLCNDATPVSFANITNSSMPVIGVEWIFEGGTPATSTDLDPEVIFGNVGDFDVTLIVDNGSCVDTLVKPDYIKIGAVPVASFIMTPDEGCAPLPVTFKNMSSVSAGLIETWDWGFGNGETSNLQDATHTFTEGGDMSVSLRVTTDGGCQDSVVQMLSIFPIVSLAVSEDTTICQGETANLTASILSDTTGVSYFWETNSTLSCTDCFNPTVNPMDTTTYVFVATSPEGCEYKTSVTVNVRDEAVPVLTISNDTTICANDVTQIFVTGGDDIFGYIWDASAEGLTCYNACNNPVASPISNTTYTVTVTNISGCSSTASSTVSVFYEFQNILGEDRTICLGDTAHLNIETGNNPMWLVSNGLSCSQCADPIASPLVTTTYVVRVESDFGCDIIDSITIHIFSPEDMDAGDDIDICVGQTAQLTGFGDGMPSWSPAATLNQTDILNPVASPTENTMYYFSLENGGCIMTDSMEVRIIEKTEIELLDQTICEGETIVMQPIGFADTYQWSPPESLTITDIENPLASPQEETRYTVIAQLGTCPPDTASAIVEVLEKPKVAIASVYQFFPGEPVLLTVEERGVGDYIYQWSPATGLSCTDCQSPTATVDSVMNYIVLITDVLNGCTTAKEIKVRRINECSDELISMPNAFTPNGDGQNDFYRIYSGAIDDIDYFRVFNRWGVVVYETNDRYAVWDGKMNGKTLPEGVYIYSLSAKCRLDGSTILKKGDITIHY